MTAFANCSRNMTASAASANVAEASFSCANTTRAFRMDAILVMASFVFVSLISLVSVILVIRLAVLLVVVLLAVLLIMGTTEYAKDA